MSKTTNRAPIPCSPKAWELHRLLSIARPFNSDCAELSVAVMMRILKTTQKQLQAVASELQGQGILGPITYPAGANYVWQVRVLVPMRGARKRIEDLEAAAKTACAAIPGETNGGGLD